LLRPYGSPNRKTLAKFGRTEPSVIADDRAMGQETSRHLLMSQAGVQSQANLCRIWGKVGFLEWP